MASATTIASEPGSADRAERYLRGLLHDGKRIMGFGHRVYHTHDPRAENLHQTLARLSEPAATGQQLELARVVERTALHLLAEHRPHASLHTNMEFYTALLLSQLGVPLELMTLVFAATRCAGWLAHAAEQRESGDIIRPRARYVGPAERTDSR